MTWRILIALHAGCAVAVIAAYVALVTALVIAAQTHAIATVWSP
jgi:hypothetical protein